MMFEDEVKPEIEDLILEQLRDDELIEKFDMKFERGLKENGR